MKRKTKNAENIDYFGDKWELTTRGKELIDKCQNHIWNLHLELMAQSVLFRNLSTCEFKPDELYGIGLFLERVSQRLRKISDLLERENLREMKESTK